MWPECCLLRTHVLGTAQHIVLTVMHMAFTVYLASKHAGMFEFLIYENIPCDLCHITYVRNTLSRPHSTLTLVSSAIKKNINLLENILNFSCELKTVFSKLLPT